MGFGFNLLFAFIIVPLMGILLLAWVLTTKRIFGLVLGLALLGSIGMFFLLTIFNWITTKKELKRKDY